MFELTPNLSRGSQRSDRHGIIQCDPKPGTTGPALDPGNIPVDRTVMKHGPLVRQSRDRGAPVADSRTSEQAGSLCGQAGGLANDQVGKPRKQRRVVKQLWTAPTEWSRLIVSA